MSVPAPVNLESLRGLFRMLLSRIREDQKREMLYNLNSMVTPVNIEYYLEGHALDTMLLETMVLIFLHENKVGA